MSPIELLLEALNICGQEQFFEEADIKAAYDWLKKQQP